jgi:precorrin-3B synthase
MTAQAMTKPQRRGACPGLSRPMPTGDGLLVRLLPRGTLSLAAFAALAQAARDYGNGVIEITSRGSIQVRGLSDASARQFADTIAALDIAAEDGVPVLCNPLAGLDAAEIFDAAALAASLRRAIAQGDLAARLSPKISVVVDGGGAIGLAALAADIRLRARMMGGETMLEVGVAGDEERAIRLGEIEPARGVDAALRLLDIIAEQGREARGRNILAAKGAQVFRSAIAEGLSPARPREQTVSVRPAIGTFLQRDGKAAVGIGVAFGHAHADAYGGLIETADACGASGLRAAPGRALLAIGLALDRVMAFTARVGRLGFVTQADDPRRKVIACAGAPICASAHIAARALAPAVAAHAASFDGTIHISGCAKGCAHAGTAALTIVGTPEGGELIANGRVSDAPFAEIVSSELPQAIVDHVRQHSREVAHV